jgi:hypothetical protein
MSFITKDSGKREEYASGMKRDVQDDKVDFDRVFDGPMLERWAGLLTRGAKKYNDEEGQPNWMKANGYPEMERARKSAARHFTQWRNGDTDEDHAAAVIFNLNLYEYIKGRLASQKTQPAAPYCDRPRDPDPYEGIAGDKGWN